MNVFKTAGAVVAGLIAGGCGGVLEVPGPDRADGPETATVTQELITDTGTAALPTYPAGVRAEWVGSRAYKIQSGAQPWRCMTVLSDGTLGTSSCSSAIWFNTYRETSFGTYALCDGSTLKMDVQDTRVLYNGICFVQRPGTTALARRSLTVTWREGNTWQPSLHSLKTEAVRSGVVRIKSSVYEWSGGRLVEVSGVLTNDRAGRVVVAPSSTSDAQHWSFVTQW